MNTNSSPLSLLTVLNPGGSSIPDAMKPSKTIDQLVMLMCDRGLTITDEERLRRTLYDCNYYRLSGYFRAFQKDPAHGDNDFRPGVKDTDFLTPYTMDERLRSVILKGTARVELTLRSRFAYLSANAGHAYDYLDPDSYVDARNRSGLVMRDGLLDRMRKWMNMSNEVCIRHYRRTGRPVPIWAAVETFPFDTFSRMLSLYADTDTLKELYRSVGIRTNHRTASEIIHAMVYLRNLCSHHSRLWHREMVISPPVTRDMRTAFPMFEHEEKSVASSLLALMYLVERIDGNGYSGEITGLIESTTDYSYGISHPLHWE
ncbi:DNA-binding protein [Bifidobacterium sp. DSM 109957]|uniref:DNA-binding protein n=1 Tax=Bifidobacterium oedipodis TaxID=2675322 RepID=A0A7Y0EMW0_9BIFI|nr:Abi family protein [Bifidobacterium sp. DSM 109957]NMM93156.1 DNA-binding protein [Bifidobacterium sp. DSM 109957]